MSNKVQWVGSRINHAPRPALIQRFVTAKAKASSETTHIGLMINGDCWQYCNYTGRNTILLPVAAKEPDCPQCKFIMRRDNIRINMAVRFEEMR